MLAARGVTMLIPAIRDSQPTGVYAFQVNAAGDLLFPPPVAALTPNPLHIADLSREQAELWRSAQELEAQSNGAVQAIHAYTKFLTLSPPPGFGANSIYSLGLLHMARGEFPEAANAFRHLAEDGPAAATESGMPLKPLALSKLLGLQSQVPESGRADTIENFCSNVGYQPT